MDDKLGNIASDIETIKGQIYQQKECKDDVYSNVKIETIYCIQANASISILLLNVVIVFLYSSSSIL